MPRETPASPGTPGRILCPCQGGNVALVRSCVSSSIPKGPELLLQGFNSFLISGGSLAVMPWLRSSPGPGQLCLPSPPGAQSDVGWTELHPNTGTAQQPSAFQNPQGNVTPGRAWGSMDGKGSVGIPCGAQDAQGVRAPRLGILLSLAEFQFEFQFCSPLLSFNSRPVEIRDQQNKSSCSSSLSLAFSQAVFFVGRVPLSTVRGQDVQWDLSWDEFLLAQCP